LKRNKFVKQVGKNATWLKQSFKNKTFKKKLKNKDMNPTNKKSFKKNKKLQLEAKQLQDKLEKKFATCLEKKIETCSKRSFKK